MKKTKILFWVFTGIFSLLMLSSAVPNILVDNNSVEMVHKMMGFPIYFIPFIGVAKLLGVIAILVPGFPRVKEWAYSGLVFDLIAATYSLIMAGVPFSSWIMMSLFFVFAILSYIYYHKLERAKLSSDN